MSLAVLLGVGALGGAGAVARFALDGAVSGRVGRAFPSGTLLVNLLGAFALGVLAGVALGASAYRLLATGLVGGFTTFSTWMLESHRLGEEGRLRLGALNLVGSLIVGLLALWAGRRLGRVL